MKKKKKKGFTLIEMLAVIVIVGILAFLVVPKISQLMGKGKNVYYSTLEKEISVIAQDYYASNRNELPLTQTSETLTASTMIHEGYINSMFKDANGEACNNSFAVVTMDENNKYSYVGCLMCADYESEVGCDENLKKTIGFVSAVSYKHRVKEEITDAEINAIKDNIASKTDSTRSNVTIDDDFKNVDVNIIGKYEFTYSVESKKIYKFIGYIDVVDDVAPTIEGDAIYSEKGETIDIQSKITILDNYYDSDDIIINLVEIDPIDINQAGSYTVVVTATDPSGNETSKEIVIVIYEKKVTFSPSSSSWTNQDVLVTMTLDEIEGLTISSWEYRVGTINSGGTSWGSYIEEIGNQAEKNLSSSGIQIIEVTVTYSNGISYIQTSGQYRIDKTAPQCGTVTGGSTTWTNSDRTVSIGCKSSISGCTETSYSHTFSTTTHVGEIAIANNAGTSINCNVNAYVDKTSPRCGDITTIPANASSSNWTKNQRQVNIACDDDDSGCITSEYSATYSTSQTETSIQIRDIATNTTTCNVPVYVDTINPSCSLQVTTSGVSFANKTDDIAVSDYGMNKTGTASYNSTTSLELSTGTFYGYVKDAAGNNKNCSVTLQNTQTTYTCRRPVYRYVPCSASNFNNKDGTCYTLDTANYYSDDCSRTLSSTYSGTCSCSDKLAASYASVTECQNKCGGTCIGKDCYSGGSASLSCGSYSNCDNRCKAAGYASANGTCTASYNYSGTIICKKDCKDETESGNYCYTSAGQSSCSEVYEIYTSVSLCSTGYTRLNGAAYCYSYN